MSAAAASLQTRIHNGVQQVERRLEHTAQQEQHDRANRGPEKLAAFAGTLTTDQPQATTVAIPTQTDSRYEDGIGELETPKDYNSV